jgi:hypothetical protein
MLAPSKTRFGLPEVLSTMAGMRPLAVWEVLLVSGRLRQEVLSFGELGV